MVGFVLSSLEKLTGNNFPFKVLGGPFGNNHQTMSVTPLAFNGFPQDVTCSKLGAPFVDLPAILEQCLCLDGSQIASPSWESEYGH